MKDVAKSRTVALIGEDKVELLQNSCVAIVGVGGVGGYACEVIARSGVGKIIVMDGDCVDESNLNRQIISNVNNIGKLKAEVAKDRILSINTLADVVAISKRFNESTVQELFSHDIDYIADCIDSLSDKLLLVATALQRGVNIISAMGAGNRSQVCNFEITDIYKTQYDPLAKKFRGMLKKQNVNALKVCYTKDLPQKVQKGVASIAYNPALCGIKIGGYIISQIAKLDT